MNPLGRVLCSLVLRPLPNSTVVLCDYIEIAMVYPH